MGGVGYTHQDKEGWREEAGVPLSLSEREGYFERIGLIHAGPIFLRALQMHDLPLATLLARGGGLPDHIWREGGESLDTSVSLGERRLLL